MNQTLTHELVRELLEGVESLPDATFDAPWATMAPPNSTRDATFRNTNGILLPARIGASSPNAGSPSFQTYSILFGMMTAILFYSLWKMGELNK